MDQEITLKELKYLNKVFESFSNTLYPKDFKIVLIGLHQHMKFTSFETSEQSLEVMEQYEGIAIYLMSLLTNVRSLKFIEYIQDFKSEGLTIAGMIFYKLIEGNFIKDLNLKKMYLFYSSVCYSLANNFEKSFVIAEKLLNFILSLDLLQFEGDFWTYITLTLQKNFSKIYSMRVFPKIKGINKYYFNTDYFNTDYFFSNFVCALIENNNCLIFGKEQEEGIFSELKEYALEMGKLDYLMITSLMCEVIDNFIIFRRFYERKN